MMSRLFSHIFAAAFLVGVFSVAPAVADDIGKQAQVCVACHGVNGNTPIADYPKLGGQSRKYLLYTMRAYKSGDRKDPIMNAQLAGYSDEDLQKLAAYFAEQESDLSP